jgi:hypothetical protein
MQIYFLEREFNNQFKENEINDDADAWCMGHGAWGM